MTQAAKIADIKKLVLSRVQVLGNSETDFKDLANQLVNEALSEGQSIQTIADGAGLSYHTVERMRTLEPSELGEAYNPSGDTLQRIFKHCRVAFTPERVKYQSKYLPKPKTPV